MLLLFLFKLSLLCNLLTFLKCLRTQLKVAMQSRHWHAGPDVDPAAVRAGKERYNVGNVFRRAEALQRGQFAKLFNLCVCLIGKEELGRHRAWAAAFTVILRPRSSLASKRTSPSRPALEAIYGP